MFICLFVCLVIAAACIILLFPIAMVVYFIKTEAMPNPRQNSNFSLGHPNLADSKVLPFKYDARLCTIPLDSAIFDTG